MPSPSLKPRVFIGSSVPLLSTAYDVQQSLKYDCNGIVWNQGVFQLNNSTLDDLLMELEKSDFGIFVFGPDDSMEIGGQQYQATRDNVVFELGLFLGKLGKGRAFFLMPQNRQGLRLPSDLIGVNPPEYDDASPERLAALGPACNEIRKKIKALGIRPDHLTLDSAPEAEIDSVFCVSSRGFEQLGIDEDISILERTFPGKVKSYRSSESRIMPQKLLANRGVGPGILHLVVTVDPKSGDLVFSGKPSGWHRDLVVEEEMDVLSIEGLVQILEESKPRLVVLASCNTLYTAALLSNTTNVVGVSGIIGVYEINQWLDVFYANLANGYPFSKAFDLAKAIQKQPLVRFVKQDFRVKI